MCRYKSVFSITVVLLVYSHTITAADAPVTNKPEYKVGDYWEVDGMYNTVDCEHWEMIKINNEKGTFVQQCGEYRAYYVHQEHHGPVKIIDRSGDKVVAYEPLVRVLDFPLEVGKSWEHSYTGFTASDGARWESQAEYEIDAYEKVEVEAGTFNAYKIHIKDHWRAGPLMGTHDITAWWSPEAGMFVRYDHPDPRWAFELTSYSR